MLTAAMAGAGEPVEVLPLARLDDRGVASCGFAFAAFGQTVELRLDRGPEGALPVIAASGGGAADVVPRGDAPDCEGLRAPDADPARLFQAVALRGAAICVATTGGLRHAELPGPLPQSVRALFLNCAGDLYRQER